MNGEIFASKISGQFAPALGGQFDRRTQNTGTGKPYRTAAKQA